MDRADAALTLSVIGLIPTIYGAMLPPLSTVMAESGRHLVDAERMATYTAAAVVLAVTIKTGSTDVAWIGGLLVTAYAAAYRSAARSGAQQ